MNYLIFAMRHLYLKAKRSRFSRFQSNQFIIRQGPRIRALIDDLVEEQKNWERRPNGQIGNVEEILKYGGVAESQWPISD
jgi:hypothetical protein